MAYDHAELAAAVALQSSATDIIDVASGVKYCIVLTIHNVNTTTETVSIYRVPNAGGSKGSASDTTNRIYYEALPAGSTRIVEIRNPGWQLRNVHDSLQGKCTVNSKVLVWVDGGAE
jgi:hypothetical protein